MASIILPPGSAPANPSEGELYYDNTAKQVKFRDNAGFKALGTADLQGEPHIITKKLFPAYLGKLLDDTTSHSGDYGTEQADGRMYYYTDIAGSKPIHDPRIGAHFGTQRHLFKSVQLLEQETATHGSNVYSVDGRDWIRCCATDKDFYTGNSTNGNGVFSYGSNSTSFFEITGYFNGINFSGFTHTSRGAEFSVNGGSASTSNFLTTSAMTPLRDRYVPAGSYVNLTSSLTLGINTIKIIPEGADTGFWFGIELIAQDTTSSSTKVQIQVPAQDVVSYGRKFSVSATAQHYDPFNGFSSGNATVLATKVDTATSLGLAKWLHSGTYYRPYNGMRVVRWIDENGAIKTSVTCMPPNAKSIGNSSSLTNANAKANASVANDTFYPTFEAHTSTVNEDNLHELAKSFHFREFGNGAANGGTGATWADFSMLNTTTDDVAFCMDDGLTALVGNDVRMWDSVSGNLTAGDGDSIYFTFIGTGVSTLRAPSNNTANEMDDGTFAQNLPYGTHIFKYTRNDGSDDTVHINGILVFGDSSTNGYLGNKYFNIYQPKKPPIPDSACVLADYMVFADFKPQTTAGTQLISKGVRRQNISRDVFFDETDGDSFSFGTTTDSEGFRIDLSGNADSDTSMKMRIPSFGTNYVHRGYQSDARAKLFIGDTDNDSSATKDNTAGYGSYAHLTSDLTLGVYQFGANATSGTNGYTSGFDIVTPVHTSHHYQTFETLFLHELIGGDRSMEQTNLICSSDGKSWDEINRDTSYIGNLVFVANEDSQYGADTSVIFNDRRGTEYTYRNYFNKDSFAIGYDRDICLKDGWYHINVRTASTGGGTTIHGFIRINGSGQTYGYPTDSGTAQSNGLSIFLRRGDYIEIRGKWNADGQYNNYEITRLK